MVCIPVFDVQHSCVLVDLQTLTCKELKFSTTLRHKYNPNSTNKDTDVLQNTTLVQDIDSDNENV